MTALALGLGLTACYVVGLWGIAMMRDQGAAVRFAGGDAPVEGRRTGRRDPLAGGIDRLAARAGPRVVDLLSPERRQRLRRRLDAAGRPQGMTIETYAGRKVVHTVAMSIAGALFLVGGNVLLGFGLPLLGFLFLDLWLGSQARRRQRQIDRALPDFLDILAVSVSAGVGFVSALRRTAEITPGPLGEELGSALSQMDFGSSRREAFRELRARNRSESLGKFVTALLQAEELGVPLTDTLADLARDMRRFFHQDARRRAARAAPRVSLIVTLVIVPGAVVMIVAAFLFGSGANLGGLGG